MAEEIYMGPNGTEFVYDHDSDDPVRVKPPGGEFMVGLDSTDLAQYFMNSQEMFRAMGDLPASLDNSQRVKSMIEKGAEISNTQGQEVAGVWDGEIFVADPDDYIGKMREVIKLLRGAIHNLLAQAPNQDKLHQAANALARQQANDALDGKPTFKVIDGGNNA